MALISNGTTIFDNGSMASGFGGNLIFISKATASSSASIEFTSGIDSTYKEYVFYFVSLHHGDASQVGFQFNMSTDGGSNYNVTKTTTNFYAFNSEPAYGNENIAYGSSYDLAQSTSFQNLTSFPIGNANDDSFVGYLHLFNPSSTTYVKHFTARSHQSEGDSNFYTNDTFVAGYGNTTSAVNAIKFQMSSGNIDSGEILLFGVN